MCKYLAQSAGPTMARSCADSLGERQAMRRRIAWALAASMALGVTTTTVFADDDPPPTPKTAPASGWAGPLKDWNKPAPKPQPKKVEPPAPPKPTLSEKVQAARYKEQADLLRRLAICDKLKEIAERTNDPELERKAEQLEERANSLYADHSQLLARTVESANNATSVAQADSNKLLNKKDGSTAVASKGDKP